MYIYYYYPKYVSSHMHFGIDIDKYVICGGALIIRKAPFSVLFCFVFISLISTVARKKYGAPFICLAVMVLRIKRVWGSNRSIV